jgi:hypothetical protein
LTTNYCGNVWCLPNIGLEPESPSGHSIVINKSKSRVPWICKPTSLELNTWGDVGLSYISAETRRPNPKPER